MNSISSLPHDQNHSLHSLLTPWISGEKFTAVTDLLREFCLTRGMTEVHTQNRLSILAACEDPRTISTFEFAGQKWPLPQTGQMWLEYEILKRPTSPGVFCLSTSYRAEPHPVEGRHAWIFPMFEFEIPGGLAALEEFEKDLLTALGFGNSKLFGGGSYLEVAAHYGVQEIDRNVEERIGNEIHPVFFLKHFPEHTHPFWNMQRASSPAGSVAQKIDVLLHGMETIGSAERGCDPREMRDRFYEIENGRYAGKLFELFGKERVERELEEFLKFPFFPRSGGGIGITRLIRAMEKSGILEG